MFEFFSKRSSVIIDPLYRNGDSMAFACDTLLDSDQGIDVRDRAGNEAHVEIHGRRRSASQTWIYFAEVTSGSVVPDGTAYLHKWRHSDRTPTIQRVRAPQLPSYSALTEDLSIGGCQLVTQTPLRVDQEMELTIDLDGSSSAIQVDARVCWSRMTEPMRAGLVFLNVDQKTQSHLRDFIQSYGQVPTSLNQMLPSHPAAEEQPLLQRQAYLKDGIEDEDGLLIKLLTDDEMMEMRFRRHRLLFCDLDTRMIAKMVTENTEKGATKTIMLDKDGRKLVEIESDSPEIVCRAVRLSDLD